MYPYPSTSVAMGWNSPPRPRHHHHHRPEYLSSLHQQKPVLAPYPWQLAWVLSEPLLLLNRDWFAFGNAGVT